MSSDGGSRIADKVDTCRDGLELRTVLSPWLVNELSSPQLTSAALCEYPELLHRTNHRRKKMVARSEVIKAQTNSMRSLRSFRGDWLQLRILAIRLSATTSGPHEFQQSLAADRALVGDNEVDEMA
ncbi:hypothetical protein HBI81_009630 [Parastagonospora nodorum]|nr:hypothetical protein HBI73_129990 [Parastagonospora nodorum]KAH5339221.1 hypothetical protein HBI12_011550 [Parastagonospora nodorum]KAH6277504.1 hypothetical protein HBI41_051470 [Parastagonospora nodorum]KAH6298534.1 hypothetical protein HBI40_047870 [Parastagonospora nodorum]KAH6327708.1 hypothetical protein HBI38_044750 [Parastagonospora nodorum]